MPATEILAELAERQIRLTVEDGRIRFFAKPGAMTDAIKARIAACKPELISLLSAQAEAMPSREPERVLTIPNLPPDQVVPLSFAQARLWYLDQLEGPSATYNISDGWRLRGATFQLAALEKAVTAIVQRHDALRTIFVPHRDAAHPRQIVQPVDRVPVPLEDLSVLPAEQRWDAAVRRAQEFVRQPFDLGLAPLLRAIVCKIAPDDHLFVLVVHHIVYDRWSSAIVRRELEVAYRAAATGQPLELPPLNISYADYAAWEHSPAAPAQSDASLDFWRDYLKNAPAVLELPTDFPRPAKATYRGEQVQVSIPSSLVQSLHALGRGERATLFHVVLAAWNIVLHRYSGQSDLVVGIPVSNRGRVELEPLVGFFVNTLALRTECDGAASVREIIRRIQQSSLAALAHGEVPFERLVHLLNPPRIPGVSPVFQVALSLLNDPQVPHRFHDLEMQPVPLAAGGAKFDLTLWLTEEPEGLRTRLEFASDLFSRERAGRMLAHFSRIVQAMVDAPEALVDELPLLAEAEKREILTERNRTERDYPRDRLVHELHEDQAQLRPEACALVFNSETLSYRELHQRADRLAAYLRTKGVGPDVLVGLCVQRSLDMVVGVLGILKAGGAYVPIDPTYPADRIAFVLEDSRAPVLVTERRLANTLPASTAHRVILDEPLPAFEPAAAPAARPTPDSLAYVLYTSGSTGKPKGVQISHRAVVNFLHSMRREPGLAADDVLLAVTTLSFDIAGLELHLPLTTGARIILAPWQLVANGPALLQTIAEHKVTVLQATPATWRLLLAAGWKGTPGLRALCGGEPLPADLARELLPRCAAVWNMYGPTETTIWSTCARVTDAVDIHIGRPIDNTEIYILDPKFQPLPIGLAGELLIGGDGLARGYLNRPELTAEKFIPHPFRPGARLYRTGDLARWREDGNIDCLGRLDFQVKIRGFRIELGEIENQLVTHPEVKQAVVVAREDVPGDRRLVAYLIPRHSVAPDAATLRAHLRGKLPDYMVPAAFVTLAEMPLTPNGKIDRRALPAPGVATDSAPAAVVSRSSIEERLIVIFEEVLHTRVTSTRTSFFDLGGHSLSGLTLITAINRSFGSDLSPAVLFEQPTIAGLSALLSGEDGRGASPVTASTSTGDTRDLRIAHAKVTQILSSIASGRQTPAPAGRNRARMRESWFCKYVVAPLYAINRHSFRNLVSRIIVRLEGGPAFTVTMRKLFARHHQIEIGDYSALSFNVGNLKPKTKIGRYCSIFRTAVFQNADHPRNTVSTHGMFYHPGFGFTEGYPLDRVEIEVGNDVWIGNDAKILYPTRKIGDGAVIAAGAVVVEDVPPYAIVGGYPARVLRYRFSKQTIQELLASRWWEASLDELHSVRDQFMVPLEGDKIR